MPGRTIADARRSGTWRRGLVALLLWLGFYGLGVGIAVALLSLPYAQTRFEGQVGISGILCILAALTVLWALFPRFEKFDPPSPALDRRTVPRLAALVDDIAARVGHPLPEDLFLTPGANAFAGRHKRQWYQRGRAGVGVGLALFQLCDRDELASVVAHEMGHHSAGDVALGPWIHHIRRSIGGALKHLEGSSFWLHLPFVGYAEMFLRITRRSSREQEIAADALAARTCGVGATAAALVRIHRLGPLWDAYWQSEVIPLIVRGFRPPLFEGFRRVLALPAVRDELAAIVREKDEEAPHPHDTHPLLAERLTALDTSEEMANRAPPEQGARAWFDDLDAVEQVVVRSILKNPDRVLAPIAWDEVGEKVWIPHWREVLSELDGALRGVSLSALPALVKDPTELVARLPRGLAILSPQAERQRARDLLRAWLSVRLHDAGFAARAEPGAAIQLQRDGATLEPDAVLRDLADGKLTAEDWRARCAAVGLGSDSM